MPPPYDDRPLAQTLFEAYNDSGPNPWKAYDGQQVPTWAQLDALPHGAQVKAKWEAVAIAARNAQLFGKPEKTSADPVGDLASAFGIRVLGDPPSKPDKTPAEVRDSSHNECG